MIGFHVIKDFISPETQEPMVAHHRYEMRNLSYYFFTLAAFVLTSGLIDQPVKYAFWFSVPAFLLFNFFAGGFVHRTWTQTLAEFERMPDEEKTTPPLGEDDDV